MQALTKNLTQAIAGAVVFFLVLAGGQMLFVGLNEGRRILEVSPTTLTGLDWMPDAIRPIIACCAVAIVLALQYSCRWTQLSRRVLVLGAFLCLFARLLPWNVAYALQKTMVRSSNTSSITLRFGSSCAPCQDSSGVSKDILQGQFGGTSGDAVVYLPVTIAGLPSDSLLKAIV